MSANAILSDRAVADVDTPCTPELDFLGWDAPALPIAAARLAGATVDGETLRLERAVVVLPGGRAGRRLKELLLDEATNRSARLLPPRVTTIGSLPELLYEPTLPLADPALSRRLWTRALREASPAVRDPLFPIAPEQDDLRGWTRLGRKLESLHVEVSAAGLRFAQVVERCSEGLLFDDRERWSALAAVQQAYERLLRSFGFADRDLERIEALRSDRLTAPGDLWLIGVAEMPLLVREMILRLALRTQVRVLVHATADAAELFDEVGCVRPAAWLDRPVPLLDRHLSVVERPADQAADAVAWLASLRGRYAADDIVVAVPSTEVVPYVEQRLTAGGVHVRAAEGTPIESTGPYRLLDAVAEYLDGSRFDSLCALARHPDLGRWLQRPAGARPLDLDEVIEALDRFSDEHLPARLGRRLPAAARSYGGLVKQLRDRLETGLLAGFRADAPLGTWAERILELLIEVYGTTALDRGRPPERRLIETLESLRGTAAALHRLPPSVDAPCSGADGIRVLLDEMRGGSIPAAADRAAVELLGWLELHLDDSPVAVITGFNEPDLPQSVNSDPFLPNAIRTRLGLLDNDRRYARDAYQLTAMVHSREKLRVISGRRTAEGDPLRPSRLMFALSGAPLASRVLRFYRPEQETVDDASIEAAARAEERRSSRARESGFSVPPEPVIRPARPIEQLRVTDFRRLLADPYDFALQRVLGLGRVDDVAREMDPLSFGSLAHTVLERFARSDGIHSPDVEEITEILDAQLEACVVERFDPSPLPAVRVQVEQLRSRLHAFARWQAEWFRQGWRVAMWECEPEAPGVPFAVDGAAIHLSGRIDRIDHHPGNDAWAVFDYKTGDKAKEPDDAHRTRSGAWIDLQLPLYRHLLPSVRTLDGAVPGASGTIQLGYISLPRDLSRVRERFATWTPDDLAAADEVAREVVRALRSNAFTYDGSRSAIRRDSPLAPLVGLGHLAGAGDSDEEPVG